MTTPENTISLAAESQIDQLCDQFEETWCSTDSRAIERLLESLVAEPERSMLLRRLLEVDLELFLRDDLVPNEADYQRRFPEHSEVVADVFLQLRTPQAQNADVRGEASTIGMSQTDATPVQSSLLPPTPIPTRIGRFEVIEVLGRGGFGTVYRARDAQMGRDVAIKVPGANRLPTPTDAQRFLREAKAAAALRHANVCAVHEIGENNGHPFIVMDYIAGEPLSEIIERGDRLPVERILQVVRELALALECVHQQGIIHRDLKPANVIIDHAGTPVIMDFGLARLQESDDNTITLGGDVLGTPAYMPLEQARGDVQAIDARSDVYSLGAILYELLCGQRPYRGRAPDIIGQIQHAAPLRPSKHDSRVDRRLEAICLKAMSRSVGQRYQSMAAFAAALLEFSETSNDNHRPLHRRTGWLAAALLFASGAAAVIYIQTDRGWLQIESYDEDVQLIVTQDGREVAIVDTKTQSRVRLHTGEYAIKLQGDRNDITLSRSRFAMTRGDHEIVSVQRIHIPSTHADAVIQTTESPSVDTQSPPEMEQTRQTHAVQKYGDGIISIDDDSLRMENDGGGLQVLFGDPTWRDIDFHAECLQEEGTGNVFLYYRCVDRQNRRQITLGSFKNTYLGADLWKDGVWSGLAGIPWSLKRGEWQCVRIEVRGERVEVFLNDKSQLAATTSEFPSGMVGLAIGKGRARFRNLHVTSPTGEALWEGLPDVSQRPKPHSPQNDPPTSTDSPDHAGK